MFEDNSSIKDALKETFRFCEKALVEKFVEGREFTCALLSDQIGRRWWSAPPAPVF